jgi:hypothetical protein
VILARGISIRVHYVKVILGSRENTSPSVSDMTHGELLAYMTPRVCISQSSQDVLADSLPA